MPASTTETVGFCDQVIRLMQDNQQLLRDKGLDVTNWITEIGALKDDTVQKDAEQDALRAASKAKTKEAQTSNKLAYRTTSTRLDAIIGVLGKDTPLAKQAARLRSTLTPRSRPRTTPIVNP